MTLPAACGRNIRLGFGILGREKPLWDRVAERVVEVLCSMIFCPRAGFRLPRPPGA